MQIEPAFNPSELLASGLWQALGMLAGWFWELSFRLKLMMVAVVVVRVMWPQVSAEAAPIRRRRRWRRRNWDD